MTHLFQRRHHTEIPAHYRSGGGNAGGGDYLRRAPHTSLGGTGDLPPVRGGSHLPHQRRHVGLRHAGGKILSGRTGRFVRTVWPPFDGTIAGAASDLWTDMQNTTDSVSRRRTRSAPTTWNPPARDRPGNRDRLSRGKRNHADFGSVQRFAPAPGRVYRRRQADKRGKTA